MLKLEQADKYNKKHLFASLFFPVLFLATIWLIKIWETLFHVSFAAYGIFPRKAEGLIGIFFYPLIHGDFNHLINNSTALLLLSTGIFYFYRPVAYRIYFWTYIMSGIWIWVSARESYHIGSSGLIYGFASFIFFSGIIRSNINLLALSMLVIFLYGGMVWGIFPILPEMSWEGHFWGAFAGFILAIYFRKEGPQRTKYSWEMEEEGELPEQSPGERAGQPGDQTKIRYLYKPKENDKERDTAH